MANTASAAVVPVAGKRTGVQIFPAQGPSQDDVEELETLFGTAQSPEPSEAAVAVDSDNSKENKSNLADKTKQLRFSLAPDEHTNDDDEDEDDPVGGAKETARSLVSKTSQLLARGSMSPSELSTVSTAPPSEARMMEQARSADTPEPTVATPTALDLGDDDIDGDDAGNDGDVAGNDADASSSVTPAAFEADDPDDLLPPAPPDMDDDDDGGAPEPDSPPLNHDDDDDDDDGGAGYAMAHTPNRPETPNTESTVEEEVVPEKKVAAKKKKKVVKRFAEDESTVQTAPPKKKRKKAKTVTFSPEGMQTGPREFKAIPVSDLKNDSPSNKNLRRSKRARYEPLQFWKGERVVYGPNDFGETHDSLANMPVPVTVNRAEPTPRKPRKVSETVAKTSSKGKGKKSEKAEPALKRFDAKKLPYEYEESEEAYVWDEDLQAAMDAKVVAYGESVDLRELPRTKRKKHENKGQGLAGQAFNVVSEMLPSYVMGKLVLPTLSVKDSEGVGTCAQTFTVVSGQPGALELAYGDPKSKRKRKVVAETAQRFLLSPGDMFRIPPGNYYRLENHSTQTECMLTWTIIRPPQPLEEEEEEEED